MFFNSILKIWLISITGLFVIYILASCLERKKQRSKLLFILTEVNIFVIFLIFSGGAAILFLLVTMPFILKYVLFSSCLFLTILFSMLFLSCIKNFNIEFQKYILNKREEDLKKCSCGTQPHFYYAKALAEENPKNPFLIIVKCPGCYKHTHATNKPNLAVKSWNNEILDEDGIDLLDTTKFFLIH